MFLPWEFSTGVKNNNNIGWLKMQVRHLQDKTGLPSHNVPTKFLRKSEHSKFVGNGCY